MVYIEKSQKSVQEVVNKLQEIISEHKFGVQHIHNVKEKLKEKGLELGEECQIVDICNPVIAKEFLSVDMSLSSIMPCKISIYSDKGETYIAMNSLVQLVDDINPDLIETAQDAQDKLLKIIEEIK